MTSPPFVDVSNSSQLEQGEERYLRHIDDDCWISVLYRRTGFGYYEWETAIVTKHNGAREKKWESDTHDFLIIRGDRREELATMEKGQLRQWYLENIEGNRNSIESIIKAIS